MADFPSAEVEYIDTEIYEFDGSFSSEQVDYIDPGASSSSGGPPVVTLVSPLAGTLDVNGAVVVDVTDASLLRVMLVARFEALGIEEVIHQGDRFAPAYAGSSSRAAIVNGWRYTLRRGTGWPAAPTIDTYAFDTSGTEA